MTRPIYFYAETDEYYEFSNFSLHGFDTDEGYWPSVEHYFQAQKFVGDRSEDHRERIRRAENPEEAKVLGQTRTLLLRSDWNEVKEDVMRLALRKKFERPELRELLLSTGARPLVEKSATDDYWGVGADGKGLNRMGSILEEIRLELRSAHG